MCPIIASYRLEMATPGDRMFFSFLYLILTYNRIIVFQALQLSHRKVIMNFVNILIEHYDLDKLETLSNEEIKILLTEISFGLEFLSFEKISQNACGEINSKNLPLLNNLGSEADNRKISTESDLIKSFLAEYENVHQKKIKIENSDDEIEIIENDINIETATYAKYAEHVSEKIENGQPKYECKLCEHSGKFKSGLIHHIRTRHLGIRFECSECGELIHF